MSWSRERLASACLATTRFSGNHRRLARNRLHLVERAVAMKNDLAARLERSNRTELIAIKCCGKLYAGFCGAVSWKQRDSNLARDRGDRTIRDVRAGLSRPAQASNVRWGQAARSYFIGETMDDRSPG